MKNLILYILFITILSCKNNSDKSVKISLKEFSENVDTKVEKDFFLKNKVTNNTSIFQSFLVNNTSGLISKPGFKFMWSGFKGGGCNTPLGLCVILRKYDESFSNALVSYYQNKLIIMPMKGENGLTNDGFLPIFSDVLIDSLTIKELKLDYKFIKSGIYKANFDDKQKRYVGVTVDLK